MKRFPGYKNLALALLWLATFFSAAVVRAEDEYQSLDERSFSDSDFSMAASHGYYPSNFNSIDSSDLNSADFESAMAAAEASSVGHPSQDHSLASDSSPGIEASGTKISPQDQTRTLSDEDLSILELKAAEASLESSGSTGDIFMPSSSNDPLAQQAALDAQGQTGFDEDEDLWGEEDEGTGPDDSSGEGGDIGSLIGIILGPIAGAALIEAGIFGAVKLFGGSPKTSGSLDDDPYSKENLNKAMDKAAAEMDYQPAYETPQKVKRPGSLPPLARRRKK